MKDQGNDGESEIDRRLEMKKSSPPTSEQKRTEIVFWLGMSFGECYMTVGNKYVMKEYPFANILTLLQNGCCVMMLLGGHRAGFIDFKEFKARQWKIFSVNAIFLTMQIVTSLQALPLVAIATVVAFRNMCTVVIAFVDYTFFGNRFSNSQIVGLCVTTIGMIIYAGQDINFNFWGYMWLLGNSFATVSNTFWNKVYITKFTRELKIQTSFGVSLIQQVETLPLVIVMAFARGEFSSSSSSQEYDGDASNESVDIFSLPFFVQFVLLITCGWIFNWNHVSKVFRLLAERVWSFEYSEYAGILIGMYVFGTFCQLVAFYCIGDPLRESKRKK